MSPETTTAVALLVLRVIVGGIMAGHGLQKLTGAFSGPGLSGTRAMVTALGIYPIREQALAAALTETVGGLLTVAGLLNPLGPAMIIGTMFIAIYKVHGKKGLWSGKGGYEYNLTIIAASLSLAILGPGRWSLDRAFNLNHTGLGWASGALGLAAVCALLTALVSHLCTPSSSDLGAAEDVDAS